ncbi:cAMP-binding protein [Solibacillus silvestris]|uniref:cAMP-binding protein n=1 Tax=Solibacillus silvestris TaxID=76853 RepID=UPI003F7F2779
MKKNSKANHEETEIEQIKETFGFSHHDSEALLTHATEVQTTDVIPLEELNEYAKVDSSTTKLNTFRRENTSAILDRDGPR